MLAMLVMLARLTLFVDQCDAGTCAVYGGLYDEDDAGPIYMPQSALPACAHEGMLLLSSGKCATPRDEPSEAPRIDDGADIDLNAPAAPVDHAKYCPGDWLGHMDRPADGGAQ